jgi:heavy metal sensor kinase
MTLSIRWRLTLWNTLGLAVMLLGFAALVYGLLRHALYEQIDHKLLGALRQLRQDPRTITEADARLRHWVYEWKEHENLFAVVYEADGTVRERTEELASASVPPAPALTRSAPGLQDRAIQSLGRQRVLEAILRLGDRPLGIVFMAPLDEVDHELNELQTVLLMAVPIVLLLSGGLGYILARKALAPMERLRRSTQEITADRLDRRLPITHPKDELGQLTQTINAMIARLERSFAEIRCFTADASHELRTPLTAIRTEAEVALRQPINPAECQQLLGSILEECERLTRLTDQLLTLSREDSGSSPPVRDPVDLGALVEGIVETMRPLAEGKGLHLETCFQCHVTVRGEDTRLGEVFYNLLDNAIKYTPPGGRIEVDVKQQSGEAIVMVRDSGIGIPREHLPHVFNRFYRVDKSRSREQGSTGLGLSIAKTIVSAHGGRIELTSAPGQGTCCMVTIPAEPNRSEEGFAAQRRKHEKE